MSALLSLQFFTGQQIRVLGTPDKPLFVAADVCRILDLADVTSALRALDDDEKGPLIVRTHGGDQKMNVVTESGLYHLVSKSRKPEANAFRKWVTSEVLPSIRKTGGYQVKELSRREILQLALEAEERVAALEADVERMRPKEEVFDCAMSSGDTLLIREVAKLISRDISGGMGQKRLFKWLRANGWLFGKNEPYQSKVDAGYFELKEEVLPIGRRVKIKMVPRVTQKGIVAIRASLMKRNEVQTEFSDFK